MRAKLEDVEKSRQALQGGLEGEKNSAERNQLGQFATPPALALEMARLGQEQLPTKQPVRLLDPAVGTGVFFYAAKEVLGRRVRSATGFEIDPPFAEAASRLWQPLGLRVRPEDFCTAEPPTDDAHKATLIICNPPYVRHHHLDARQKERLRVAAERSGFYVSGLSGLYCYFMLLAHRWMAPGGVAVWIVPAEFLDVNYGRTLKQYLSESVTLLRIHRFDPEDVQFADALVSSVVVLLRNVRAPAGHRVELTAGGRLGAPGSGRKVALADLDPTQKWGPFFVGSLRSARTARGLAIGQLFTVKRGLATGANDYFILERERAHRLRLPARFLRPILPGPRQIRGDVIECNGEGFPKGLPELVLLDCTLCPEEAGRQFPDLGKYLELGRALGIPDRYLPAHRRVWCGQEIRPPAPILCTYMGRQKGGRTLRFIRNRSQATAPNVYLLLYPKPRLAALAEHDPGVIEHVFEALTEVTSLLSQGGRVYGGGLNKIEPSELAAIELPSALTRKYPSLLGDAEDGRQGRLPFQEPEPAPRHGNAGQRLPSAGCAPGRWFPSPVPPE